MRLLADSRFVALLDAAPDAMVCVDRDGRIVAVNAEAEHLFGYQGQELAGQLIEVLVSEAVRAVHQKHRAEYLADPATRPMGQRSIPLSGRRRDGSVFPAGIAVSAIETDEGILVTTAVRDMTEWQRAQEELERSSATMESFAFSVSHDLRAPLRAMTGFSGALLEECADGLGEVGLGYARRIQAAAEQMSKLIDDLFDLARASRAEVSLQMLDLGAVAASIAGELQRDSPERSVRFAIKQPVWVLADPDLVRTVLQNLLDNAWKFTARRDGAVIEFGTTAATAAEGTLCCYVRDDGVGFDPAYADRLFLPFQRLHSAREFPGTGIGLASARQIVARHGGRTWAEGAVDGGATFYFTLQAAGAS